MSRSAPRLRRRLGVGWATLVFALLLALAAAAPALAGLAVGGGVWEWQSPLPQGNRLYDVEVAPEGAVRGARRPVPAGRSPGLLKGQAAAGLQPHARGGVRRGGHQ
ncbi:MAG: hypothetical protein QM323_12350 [Acidobacteriota bacterium]|nr:hypothetical protein [Acidobacteriota bacterium]